MLDPSLTGWGNCRQHCNRKSQNIKHVKTPKGKFWQPQLDQTNPAPDDMADSSFGKTGATTINGYNKNGDIIKTGYAKNGAPPQKKQVMTKMVIQKQWL